jgi:Ser/Thr protein kinase RdoA (MazF antagonist)
MPRDTIVQRESPLFAEDLFSDVVPRFIPTSLATAAAVREVAIGYHAAIGEVQRVEQFGGSEVNSRNFRVCTTNGRYLLKHLPSYTPERERALRLWDWLQQNGAAVARVVPNDRAGLATVQRGDAWVLSAFIEGDFFSGAEREIGPVGDAIGSFSEILIEAPRELWPTLRWEYLTEDDGRVLEVMTAQPQDLTTHFDGKTAHALASSWERLLRVRDELAANAKMIRSRPAQPCHGDLHPHNLLVEPAGAVYLLDFESIVLAPVSAAIGYGIYKLLRRHMVHLAGGMASTRYLGAPACSVATRISAGLGRAMDPAELRLFAYAELMRRIVLILRLNLDQRNTSWNHVLTTHIAGVREIELIFRT